MILCILLFAIVGGYLFALCLYDAYYAKEECFYCGKLMIRDGNLACPYCLSRFSDIWYYKP